MKLVNFVCNPLRARFWFNWREPIALGISGFAFAIVFTLLWVGFDALVIGATSAAIVSVLVKFVWLDKVVLVIKCPNRKCKKFVEIDTPWLCGYKQDEVEHENINTSEYPFVRECEHCHKRPKAYQCHHCQGLIYLSEDQDKLNFAKRLGDVKTIVDERAANVTGQLEKIQDKKLEYELAKLNKQIAIVTNLPDKPETPEVQSKIDIEKLTTYLRERAFQQFGMNKAKALVIAELKEEFKDKPHELIQIEPVVDKAASDYFVKKVMEGKK